MLVDEEMGLAREAWNALQNRVEPPGKQKTQGKRQRATNAYDEAGFTEHVRDDTSQIGRAHV